ncbi:MAG: insulinase family protein, partial [Candidatus Omnitrophica bacterium]|nr:insulinase family protein [Candidatus Omnitrophota bacterium]
VAMVLGMGDSSRLNKILVKEKELLYSINSFNYTPLYPGLFIITGIGDPGNLENAVAEIKKEIQNVKQGGITQAECEKAKALVLSGYLESLQTVQSQARAIAQGQMLTGDPDFSKKYVAGIKKVKLEDIDRVAEKYLTDGNCTIVYLSPQSMVPASAKASAGKHSPRITPKTKTNAAKYVLPNGIRVILKEERELPLVSIIFSCLGGLRAETKELNGICNLTGKMLLKGTNIRKEKDIKGSMENIGGGIASFSGMNSFGLSLKFMSKDTDYALELLEDVVKNSVFPENEMEKLKNKIVAGIKIENDDIFQKGLLELKNGIFKTHPYGRRIAGETETIERIKKSDIIKFYKNLLNPENIVVTLVGDFDSEALLKDIKKRFSTLLCHSEEPKATKNLTLDSSPPSGAQNDNSSIKEKLMYMPKEEALFVIGFKGADVKTGDRYALEVISSVMSGNNGRLFHSVRDRLGLSYTQGFSSIAGLDPGYCFFYVATDKKDMDRARDIILSEISKIKSKPVSDIELVSGKNSLITKQIMSIQTNDAKAFTMALDELYSLGYKNYLHYKENVEKCSKSDIIRVANKYFDLDKSFSVIILPEERE